MVFSRKHFFQTLTLTFFVFIGFCLPLAAQVPAAAPAADPTCTPENRLAPQLDADADINPLTTAPFKNQYNMRLAWDRLQIATSDCKHENPPSELVVGQEKQPQWVYFWNFGDGTYSRDSTPIHVFPAGTHVVQAAIKPIYSDDDDPLGFIVDTITIDAEDVTLTQPSLISPDSSVALKVNWPASRPASNLVFALSYRKVSPQTNTPQTVYLVFPEDEFEYVGMQSGPEPDDNLRDDYYGKSHWFYSWRFDEPDNSTPYNFNTLFVILRVKEDVGLLLPDFDAEVVTSVKAMFKREEAPSFDQVALLGVESTKKVTHGYVGDGGVVNSLSVDEITEQTISLNLASDPNTMAVNPPVVEPGAQNVKLDYRIDFVNDGSAMANVLTVDGFIDPIQLDVTSLQTGTTFPTNFGAPSQIEQDVFRWVSSPAKFVSLGQAQDVGFGDEHAFGFIKFRMNTEPGLILKEGDSILAHAQIQMDLSPKVTTNTAVVRVLDIRHAYPCVFGLKAYYNFRFDDKAFHRSGFSFALTMRKALGKVPNPRNRFLTQKRIPKSVLPVWWWQAELGYGQTRLKNPELDSFSLGHLDLTPFMLRFIAKKPHFKFGNANIPRGWGLSAGYTSSFLLHGKQNGQTMDLGNWDFGDRVDHSISVSLDLFNLVGQPGLSFGFGWRWRNSAVTGQRNWYDHPFVYAHYTFSRGLRYELSAFK